MTTVGPTTFAVLVWGAILGASLVFVYQIYALAAEVGWLGG